MFIFVVVSVVMDDCQSSISCRLGRHVHDRADHVSRHVKTATSRYASSQQDGIKQIDKQQARLQQADRQTASKTAASR